MSREKIRLISWNVNGMNAVMKKDFLASLEKMDADVVAVQETKLQEAKLTDPMKHVRGYTSYWSFSTVKKGYSGVAVYTRREPLSVTYGIGRSEYDRTLRRLLMASNTSMRHLPRSFTDPIVVEIRTGCRSRALAGIPVDFDGTTLSKIVVRSTNWDGQADPDFYRFSHLTITPEPTTMALLFIGGLTMLRRW